MKTTGKIALVTGAGSGIGRASALALLEAGYTVVLSGRRAEALEETASKAGAAAERALVVPADVSDESSVQNLFSTIRKTFGRLDLLFNNAGTNIPATKLEDITLSDWQTVVNVNLTGMFLCSREAFRLMKDQTPQGGRIINNGSISAITPRPESTPYTATKHAVAGLTKCAALDGRAYNIACGQINIGNAVTEMSARMQTGALQANGTVATEPMMDVKNVADAVVHMAGLPTEANILTLTVMATNMPFVGRG